MNQNVLSADTNDDSGSKAMKQLSSQWYNALVAGLGADPQKFQVLQPSAPLGNTSDALWSYFNNLPPESLFNNLDVSGGNRFYEDYQAAVSQLTSQQGPAFRQHLGDDYDAWQTYVKGLSPLPSLTTLPDVFRQWAIINAPSTAQAGYNDLVAMRNDPIANAQLAVLNTAAFKNGVPNFTKTIADLLASLAQAPGVSLSFDSATASSDTSHTWAEGSASGAYRFFFGGADGSYSHVSEKAASSRIKISGRFERALTFAAFPGAWYVSAALAAALATPDNTLWRPGTPNWESTFGSGGNMLRFVGALVVVDGIDLTIYSDATYSTDEQTEVKASAQLGFWPFFSASASGGHQTTTTFDSSGKMEVRIVSPKGNPVVLGASVIPIDAFVAG